MKLDMSLILLISAVWTEELRGRNLARLFWGSELVLTEPELGRDGRSLGTIERLSVWNFLSCPAILERDSPADLDSWGGLVPSGCLKFAGCKKESLSSSRHISLVVPR